MERQEFIKDDYLEYLDTLRESGVANMFGGGQHLMATYPELDKIKARQVLRYWMSTFEERHPQPETTLA